MSSGQSDEGPIVLSELVRVIRHAENDPRVTALLITVESPTCGWATLQEVRKALIHFKQHSHKQIITYGTSFSEKAYFIGSVADRIFLNPNGTVDWKGLSMQVMFYKDLLDKLGIEPIIYRIGEFKSAVEPFARNSMSEPSRMQSQILLNTVHQLVLKEVSLSRKISIDSLQFFANNLRLRTAKEALKTRMVTDIGYYEEVTSAFREILKKKETIYLTTYGRYRSHVALQTNPHKKQIAVIIAEGNIVMGQGGKNLIGSETLLKTLSTIQADSTVRAVVLRINSKGGSAMASNIIWRKIKELKRVKPIVASFSDYAASGGYYIGMGCSKIVANETSITGSIGIFGYWFNLNKLYQQIGLRTETVQTNLYADFPSGTRSPSKFERNLLQAHANDGYTEFIQSVAQSRNLSLPKTQSIAAGRVWSGSDALRMGLIDQIGGYTEAVLLAAREAQLADDTYSLTIIEEEISLKDSFQQVIKLPQTQISLSISEQLTSMLNMISNLNRMQGVQAHLDTDYIIQ